MFWSLYLVMRTYRRLELRLSKPDERDLRKLLRSYGRCGWHAALLASHVGRTFRGHTGTILRATLSPDGKHLATADSVIVKVWDLTSGQELRTLRENQGFITSTAISLMGGGSRLVVRMERQRFGTGPQAESYSF